MSLKEERGNVFLFLLFLVGVLIFLSWFLFVYPESPLFSLNLNEEERIRQGKTHTIEMTDKGFAPKDLKIKQFDTITFINKDGAPHWPASDVHPEHKICPGFDSLRGLTFGESYSLVFDKKISCPFHDHLNPALKGKIEVN